MYRFKLPIGDWSDDGHGKHDDYLIESNKPIEEVRNLYFQACDKIGFSLDDNYRQTDLTPQAEDYTFSKQTLQSLLDFGVNLDENSIDFIMTGETVEGTEHLCDIILAFIKTQDESLELKRVPESDYPRLQFYGCDEKQRHIGYFGYGLFD